jgi:hypothetical protein
MFADKICEKDRKQYTDGFEAVAIRIEGGFGSQFIQIITTLALALVLRIKIIYVTCPFLWMGQTNLTTQNGIQVVPIKDIHFIPFPRSKWVMTGWWRIETWCADFSYRYLAALIREPLLKLLPVPPNDPDTLFMYLRGGDIWNNKRIVSTTHSQPPCQFYSDPMRNFTKARVVGGTFHSCTPLLIRLGAEQESYNDTLAMSQMVYSHHIVLARSSRSHAVLALSPFPKHFWAFDQQMEWTREPIWWRGYSPLQFGHGLNCVPSEEFRTASFPWRASPVQIEFMLNSSCTWGAVPCAPNVECHENDMVLDDDPI